MPYWLAEFSGHPNPHATVAKFRLPCRSQCNLFVGADLRSLEAEVDFAAEDPPVMISFDLALCEQLPLVAVSFDHETQAMNVDVRSREEPTCEATPAPAIVKLHLEPGVEIRSSSMRVG